LGDYEGAIDDLEKAAQLFRAQGNMAGYQQAREILRQLQQQ